MENIYEYFVQFRKAAKQVEWPNERIAAVLMNATSGDYADALAVLLSAMEQIELEEAHKRLNWGSMNPETRRALVRFEEVTGLKARRFISNRHAMRDWFSVWVERNHPIVQQALNDYPDIKSINGLSYDYLIDDDEDQVRFDIDRYDLLKDTSRENDSFSSS
jgi:hypothetical protein